MRRTVVVATLAALFLALSAVPAWAQEGRTGEGRLEERLQERWEIVQKRIELIITRFNNNHERHQEVYQRVKAQVQELLERLKAKGYDVSELEQDLATWEGMFAEFARDYQAFIEKLEEISALSPEEAREDFYSLLREARELLRAVREDALQIRLFYQQTIRADIQELREQLPESA